MGKGFFLFFLVYLLMAGCSGDGKAPVIPADNTSANPVGSLDTLPVIGGSMNDDGSYQALGLMGAYELSIDPVKTSAELVSKRLPTLGQSWIVSGIGFFTIAPCSNCLQISSIALTTEYYLKLTFNIKHPFQKGDLLKPPSALNRRDLDVFDVALVIQPKGITPVNYALIGAKIYSGILANNAGYTKELANVTDDNAALPYALVIDNSLGGTSTYNKFAMGADSFFDVFFNLNMMTAFSFDMYLTMGYGASAANKNQRLTPTYFNPEFNRKPAWKVVVTPPQGTDPPEMGNTWDDNNGTDIYNVTVKVYDWQQGVTTINNPPVAPGDIAFASNVSRVTVEIPGMTSTLPSASTPTSGTGTPANPLVYTVPIANQNLLDAGEYIGLVKVSDTRIPVTTPPGEFGIDFLIDAPDGVTMTNYAIPEFATYQTFVATVVIGNLMPVAQAVATTSTTIMEGMSVTFDASTSYDPDGTVGTYQWDFNEDGIYAGTGDEYTGNAWNPTHIFPYGDGSWNVQLKVTDNLGGQDILNSPIAITVTPSKNIVLRAGVNISDIATIQDTDEVLVMFADSQVWKYSATLTGGVLRFVMPGTQSNQRIEACSNGDSLCGWWSSTSRDTYSYYYNGSLACDHWYTDLFPRNVECCALYGGVSNLGQMDISGWFGSDSWVWFNRYDPPNYPNGGGSLDITPGPGPNNLDLNYVKGSHASRIQNLVWVLEGDPEWRVERLSQCMCYLSGYWGGTQTDADSGFYNPLDITSNASDQVFVLDILSTTVPKIKKYGASGSVYGSFGNGTSISSTPARLDASFASGWIYVAHTDKVSVFFPSEQP